MHAQRRFWHRKQSDVYSTHIGPHRLTYAVFISEMLQCCAPVGIKRIQAFTTNELTLFSIYYHERAKIRLCDISENVDS